MAAVLKIDGSDSRLRPLVALAADRIQQHADAFQPEVKPEEYARAVIARVWGGAQDVLLLGVVDEETALLVGHVLALVVVRGSTPGVDIAQVRADENVGDALVQAVERTIKWATDQGVRREHITLFTHRDGKEWEKRLGFKRYRSLLRMPLPGSPDDRGGPARHSGNGHGLPEARRVAEPSPDPAGVLHGAGA